MHKKAIFIMYLISVCKGECVNIQRPFLLSTRWVKNRVQLHPILVWFSTVSTFSSTSALSWTVWGCCWTSIFSIFWCFTWISFSIFWCVAWCPLSKPLTWSYLVWSWALGGSLCTFFIKHCKFSFLSCFTTGNEIDKMIIKHMKIIKTIRASLIHMFTPIKISIFMWL